MNNRVALLLLLPLLLLHCAREGADPYERIFLVDRGNSPFDTNKASLPSIDSAFDGLSTSACEQMGRLNAQIPTLSDLTPSTAGLIEPSIFSLFSTINSDGLGRLNLSESPFVKFYLAERFKYYSKEEFMKLAAEKHKNGKLSKFKWWLLKNTQKIPKLFEVLQATGTNDGLQDFFPGIFDPLWKVEDSLFMSLAKKLNQNFSTAKITSNVAAKRVLTTKLPLFSQISTEQAPEQIRKSLAAALGSIYSSPAEGSSEKFDKTGQLCSLVLLERTFAQLLSIKGYWGPVVHFNQNGLNPHAAVKKLSKDKKAFIKTPNPGVFYDPTLEVRVVLEEDQIKNYNPNVKPFLVSKFLPGSGKEETNHFTGSLRATAGMLETAVYFFAATSPAAPWVDSKSNYLFGSEEELRASDNSAILPDKAHSLSLGLINMSLKNLAKYHIKKVNEEGALLEDGEEAAGIVLIDKTEILGADSDTIEETNIDLETLLSLTRSVVYLEQSLKNLFNKDQSHWESMNQATYTEDTFASLLGENHPNYQKGNPRYKKSLLEILPDSEDRKKILIIALDTLKLPIELLLMKFYDRNEGCFSRLHWKFNTGEAEKFQPCSQSLLNSYKEGLRTLAILTGSPMIFDRSKETLNTM